MRKNYGFLIEPVLSIHRPRGQDKCISNALNRCQCIRVNQERRDFRSEERGMDCSKWSMYRKTQIKYGEKEKAGRRFQLWFTGKSASFFHGQGGNVLELLANSPF